MPDDSMPQNPQAAAAGPNELMDAWVLDISGVDPRSYPPANSRTAQNGAANGGTAPGGLAAGGDAAIAPPATPAAEIAPTQAAAPGNAAPVAPPAVAPPAAPVAPLKPVEARADLERRLKLSGAIYAQYGQIGGDEMVAEKDRLTPAELKIGKIDVVRDSDVTVDGSDSRTSYDERGITIAKKKTETVARIGADGKTDELTREQTSTTNIGLGNASQTDATKITASYEGTTKTVAQQTTKSADLIKGEISKTTAASVEVKDTDGVTTRDAVKNSATLGPAGYSQTSEVTNQVGKKLDSTSTTVGLSRTQGQVGATATATKKHGLMTGPAEAQVMERGVEVIGKVGGGAVSDDKGTGAGANANAGTKAILGSGASVGTTIGGGGKIQSIVKEIPGSDPPRFTITTTISFDFTVGQTATKETAQPKPVDPRAGPDTKVGPEATHKGSASLGVTASISRTASFKHELSADETGSYLESIKQNGRGSKLPEHQILATGMKDGWEHAYELWGTLTGSVESLKDLKPGEERETVVQTSVVGKLAGGMSEVRVGGLEAGVEATKGKTHRIAFKQVAMSDGSMQVTATIDDSNDETLGGSVKYAQTGGKYVRSFSDGKGSGVVFVLNPKGDDFAAQMSMITGCHTAEDLEKVAEKNHDLLFSTTKKDSEGDGETGGASVMQAGVDILGKGTIQNEETRDRDGNIISAKSTGAGQSGGSYNYGTDLKLADSETEAFTGEVKGDKVQAEMTKAHRSASLGKTLTNIANAAGDPLGAMMNPGKLIGETVDTEGFDFGDAEFTLIAKLALDEQKWNSRVGGHIRDEWVATGKKIRAAATAKGGDIQMDKVAVNKALAGWTRSKDATRMDAIEGILRPSSGPVAGKAFEFPDGTELYKPLWDALVNANPLDAARAKAKTDPKGAQTDMQTALKQIGDLQFDMKNDADKWAGFEIKYTEMLGHINARYNEVNKALNAIKKSPPKPPKSGQKPTAVDDEMAADRQRDEDLSVDLQTYQSNLAQMKTYAEAVFGELWKAEQKLKETSLFSGSGIANTIAAMPWIKHSQDDIKLWENLYAETYQLWEKLSVSEKLDRAALEKLHVHGAKMRWAEVNELAHKV